jgi:hypothetical protein
MLACGTFGNSWGRSAIKRVESECSGEFRDTCTNVQWCTPGLDQMFVVQQCICRYVSWCTPKAFNMLQSDRDDDWPCYRPRCYTAMAYLCILTPRAIGQTSHCLIAYPTTPLSPRYPLLTLLP